MSEWHPRTALFGTEERTLFCLARNREYHLSVVLPDGQIMLDEALEDCEKLYIQKALARHKEHLSRTAAMLGIHRNTLLKRVAGYRTQERPASNNQCPRKKAARRKR